jgi:hypothetical protein
MDGDNAMQALAERLDVVLGAVRAAMVSKSVALVGVKPPSGGWLGITQSQVTVTMSAAALVYLKVASDCQGIIGTGALSQRIGSDDASVATSYDADGDRRELTCHSFLYLPAGGTAMQVAFQTFANPAAGFNINTTRWSVYAVGGSPTLT